MEGSQKAFRSISQDPIPKLGLSLSSSFDKPSLTRGEPNFEFCSLDPPDMWYQYGLSVQRYLRFSFVAGVVVGFTLKKRVRRWPSKLLRRLKDD